MKIMKMDSRYKFLYAVFVTAIILLNFCKNEYQEAKLFSHFDSNLPIKGISMTKNTLTNKENGSYKICLYYWDNYIDVNSSIKNVIYLNGYFTIEDDLVYYTDSVSRTKSLFFAFNKENFTSKLCHNKEYIYDNDSEFFLDTTVIMLKQTFWSRMYNDVIYVFRLENTDFYEANDNITLFVSSKLGILGVYSSIMNTGDVGPSETIYTYSGDVFPYIYDFSKVVFLNKMYNN